MAGERTEKATSKKRRDERKKGNVFMSRDIVVFLSMFCAFIMLRFTLPLIIGKAEHILVRYLSEAAVRSDFSQGGLKQIAMDFFMACLMGMLPLVLVCVAVPVLATGVQTKFLFVKKNLKPKFSKLNPIQGIKKLFSLKNLIELLKNLIKTTILLFIIYNFIKGDIIQFLKTMDAPLATSTSFLLSRIFSMVLKISMVLVAICGFDFFYQKWEYERGIKMTKQEVKEEFKQMEGNPQIKGKIRNMQRQRAMSRMMQAVPQADVIIKNPTHFAVALKYDSEKDSAPIVIAKGQDSLALRIIAVGEANQVTIVENRPLARALYASCELGCPIPEECYGAVAEILVYVYRMDQKQ